MHNDIPMKKYNYSNYLKEYNTCILIKLVNLFICFQMFPLTAYGLAYWQWQRRKWKLNLLKTIDERTAADPVPLTDL